MSRKSRVQNWYMVKNNEWMFYNNKTFNSLRKCNKHIFKNQENSRKSETNYLVKKNKNRYNSFYSLWYHRSSFHH